MRVGFLGMLLLLGGCYDFGNLHEGSADAAGSDAPVQDPDAGCLCPDDGNPCTMEVCRGSVCNHDPVADNGISCSPTPGSTGTCYHGACLQVVPSNGLGTDFYRQTVGAVNWKPPGPGTVTIDTDASTISDHTAVPVVIVNQPDLDPRAVEPQIAVFQFASINIPSNVTIRGKGSRALALVASGNITIAGTLDVQSHGDNDCGAASVDANGIDN